MLMFSNDICTSPAAATPAVFVATCMLLTKISSAAAAALLRLRYIIGLPLWQKNAVEMGRHMIEQAQKHLGDSLMGFELGNEVSAR
jgi:hypothetical protein